MANIQETYGIIEAAISQIGIDPLKCRGNQAGEWTLVKGDQEVWVDAWEINQGTAEAPNMRPYFQVLAPMMQIPDSIDPKFYREVLEINHDLYGVAFSIQKGRLMLKVLREADGLDTAEAYAMIMRCGNYATDYTPGLTEKYFNFHNPGHAPDLR